MLVFVFEDNQVYVSVVVTRPGVGVSNAFIHKVGIDNKSDGQMILGADSR